MLALRQGAIALRPLPRWSTSGRPLSLLARPGASRLLLRPFGSDQQARTTARPLLPPGAAARRSSGGGGAGARNSAGGGGSGRATPKPQEQQPPHPAINLDSVDSENDDQDNDPAAYWANWGDGQASSAVAAAEAAAEAAAAAAAAAEATSTALSPSAAARLFASLPPTAMFETAFFAADRDGDGRLTREEAARLLAYATATSGEAAREAARRARQRAQEAQQQQAAAATAAQVAPPQPQQQQPETWDEHLVADWRRASLAARGGVPAAALRFAARALAGRAHERDDDEGESSPPSSSSTSRPPPLPSDILWSALFAGAAVAALGALAAAPPSLPFVGAWHQQQQLHQHGATLPLLLSSFGALCVLLFARPESDAVRVWPVIAGQLAGAALAIACLTLLGTGMWARAVGMATVVGFMLWADCAHPPGGALALFAMDHAPALFSGAGGAGGAAAAAATTAGAGWAFCLWPSLALTLGVLMPLGWLCNHMKRTARFGWPKGTGAAVAAEGAAGPVRPQPAAVARPVAGAAVEPAYDPAPLRRRYHVRSSDGGGWIEDMT